MVHLKRITRTRPSGAQFEPFLELVALLSAILGLLQQASDIFGFDIPTKDQEQT